MSQYLTISHSNALTFGERRKGTTGQQSVRVGRVTLNFLLVVLICIFGVIYIFEVNNVATQGYQIRDLEQKAQELRENNEKLKLKEAELRSMYNIEQKTKDLNMVAPKDVSYISLPGNVAMK